MQCKLSRNITIPFNYKGAEAEITLKVELEKDEKDEYCNMYLVGAKVEKTFKDGKHVIIEAFQDEMKIIIDNMKIKIKIPNLLNYTNSTLYDFFICPDDLYKEGLESTLDAFIEEMKINVNNVLKDILFSLFDINLEKLKCEPEIENAKEIRIEKDS